MCITGCLSTTLTLPLLNTRKRMVGSLPNFLPTKFKIKKISCTRWMINRQGRVCYLVFNAFYWTSLRLPETSDRIVEQSRGVAMATDRSDNPNSSLRLSRWNFVVILKHSKISYKIVIVTTNHCVNVIFFITVKFKGFPNLILVIRFKTDSFMFSRE